MAMDSGGTMPPGKGILMRLVNVAAAVLNQTPLDWAGNERHVLAAIEAARGQGATVLCLPELCLTGYGCEDVFHAPWCQDMAWRMLENLLPACRGMVVSVGLPLFHRNALFNGAALVVDGRLEGVVCKRHLAGDGVHYEPRWFKTWPEGVRGKIEHRGRLLPVGDLYFDVGGILFGFEICEDAWAPSRPGARLARKGVDVILNPSASHFAFSKIETRKRFVVEGSRAFGVSYVYANLVGNEAGRLLYDGGALIASDGRLRAMSPRFSHQDAQVCSAVIDVNLTRVNRAQRSSFVPDLEDDEGACVKVPFDWPGHVEAAAQVELASWESSPYIKEEEFTRAVTMGLGDYLRKSRTQGFVVSLSGGADSSAVACLVALTLRLMEAELGLEGVKKRLGHIAALAECETLDACTNRLLSCVYQGTRNSSTETRAAAREVAEGISAEFIEWDVDEIVDGFVDLVSRKTDRQPSWETDSATLQNIQARVRAPGAWMLANLRNALLLTTSNRSEAAVGYATMDGDTCGGLAPIGSIDKDFLRRWLRWLEARGPEGLSPIPALGAVNGLIPTAELKPPEMEQTDEGDLMPYALLDDIEEAAIRDRKSPAEVLEILLSRRLDHSREQLVIWIRRFFRLWAQNQWKRERYAPSFHVDDRNLDPKTGCRFPILSGAFHEELESLG